MPRKKKQDLSLQPGSSVYYEDEHYVVLQILDLQYILTQNVQSRDIKKLRITDVNTIPKEKVKTLKSSLIEVLPDKD